MAKRIKGTPGKDITVLHITVKRMVSVYSQLEICVYTNTKTFMVVGMSDEKMRERKARSAQLAGVRLLARVNTLVVPQLVRLGKRFQADGTAVGPLVPAVDLLTVLGIRDIFMWIRIRGSMPRTNGSGCGSCYLSHLSSKCKQEWRK